MVILIFEKVIFYIYALGKIDPMLPFRFSILSIPLEKVLNDKGAYNDGVSLWDLDNILQFLVQS